MTVYEAVSKILEDHKKPMHYNDIASIIQRQELVDLKWSTPHYTVNSIITRDIKRNPSSIFSKVRPGTYTLRKYIDKEVDDTVWFFPELIPALPEEEVEILESSDDEEISMQNNVSTAFVWKAGELAVCSELLLRWYNTNVLFVDDGIDLVALRRTKRYNIQVKTSTSPKITRSAMTFYHSIKKSSFERHLDPSVFYVFVERTTSDKFDYIIINAISIKMLLQNGFITEDKNGTLGISIRFEREGSVLLGKEWFNLDTYVNDWSQLEMWYSQ